MKKDALHFFANLLKSIEGNKDQIRVLVNQNLLGILHDELYDGPDEGVLNVLALLCMSSIFRTIPEE